MAQVIQIQAGQRAIVLDEEGHFFAKGAEIVFHNMDDFLGNDFYLFRGEDRDMGNTIIQGLSYGQFELI